jgi:hypothetical protein
MSMFERIEAASLDVYGRLLEGLAVEFGSGADDALARHFIACEEADFHWEARSAERHLGACEGLDEEELELDWVAITGFLDGSWYVATALVDGEGAVQDLTGLRRFEGPSEAHRAFMATC